MGRSGWSQQKRDRILQAECHGEAWRRVVAGEPIPVIVAEVRRLAGDRSHVLVETAGIGVGAWSARPSRRWTELMVAGILLEVAEGRGFEELTYWVEVGRDRALQPPHTASAGTGRSRPFFSADLRR
jgi:hypothetical protein